MNTVNGVWNCHRCEASGKLRDFWEERPMWQPLRKRERDRIRLRAHMALPPEKPPAPEDQGPQEWEEKLAGLQPLACTPGAAYLRRRGIPDDLAQAADARFAPAWYGRPAVVFLLRDDTGKVKSAQGRLIHDPKEGPSKLSAGPITRGVFATPGAWEALRRREPVALTEAPIDALSLAVAGLPALALCGKQIGEARRVWLFPLLAFRPLLLAFDQDGAGDAAAAKLAPILRGPACGASPRRLRPPGAKDWNAQLMASGAEALRTLLADVLPADEPPAPEGAPGSPAAQPAPDPAAAPLDLSDLTDPFADDPEEAILELLRRARREGPEGCCLLNTLVDAVRPQGGNRETVEGVLAALQQRGVIEWHQPAGRDYLHPRLVRDPGEAG